MFFIEAIKQFFLYVILTILGAWPIYFYFRTEYDFKPDVYPSIMVFLNPSRFEPFINYNLRVDTMPYLEPGVPFLVDHFLHSLVASSIIVFVVFVICKSR